MRGTNDTNNQVKFKNSILKSSVYSDYSDAYILVEGTISIEVTAGGNPNNDDKEVMFKNCVPFTDCISEIKDAQIENAKNIDVVTPMHNSIEYSNNYSKTPGSLWQYCMDESFLDANGIIPNFPAADNNNASLKLKQKITRKTELIVQKILK